LEAPLASSVHTRSRIPGTVTEKEGFIMANDRKRKQRGLDNQIAEQGWELEALLAKFSATVGARRKITSDTYFDAALSEASRLIREAHEAVRRARTVALLGR